ncbi:MAG: DUF5700 domain-containing putative Zn-dependent protease [Chitinophagaceae bacterium]
MKNILLASILLALSGMGYGQVNLSFNFSNADSTIAFLKKKNASARDVEIFLHTAGVQAIIKKINSNDSIGRIVLTKISKGGKLAGKENDFQYHLIKRDLGALEKFIDSIKHNQKIIRDSVEALSAYLPAGKELNVTVCFLLGSYSSGFTFSKADVFYIGTHQYKYDFKSIVNSCQHEIFHNVQNLYQERTPVYKALEKDTASLYAFYILHNFFTEGAAEYVADLDKSDPAAPNIKHLKEHASVNNYRMADNFYLADRLILDTYKDPATTDPGEVYTILFDWNWNNPGYAMGKYMMKCLVKEYGTGAVKKYLAADPLVFIMDYITLTKTNKEKYPYVFSDSFEKMIETVLAKTAAIAGN